MNQRNGNNQVNEVREDFNRKINKYSIVGNSKRYFWNKKRRFRTI